MTSKKHQEFVKEPMGNKSVRTLPGIGDISGRRLEERGFDRASDVLGKHLVLRRDPVQLKEWLQNTSGAKGHHAKAAADCMEDWSQNNL